MLHENIEYLVIFLFVARGDHMIADEVLSGQLDELGLCVQRIGLSRVVSTEIDSSRPASDGDLKIAKVLRTHGDL